MRLVRYGPVGSERPAILVDEDVALDLSSEINDIDPQLLGSGGIAEIRSLLEGGSDLPRVDLRGVRLGSPLANPPLVVGIGLNYRDHVAESGQEMPTEPVVFLKSPDTIVGPNDPLLIPVRSTKTDWEVELAVVIDRVGRYLPDVEAASEIIAGYVLSNDVSEREFQLERGGQWDKGKSCETFNPLGPWFVTADEVGDPQKIDLWCDVNGERMQDGCTSDMIFSAHYLVWYLSQFMVLKPGYVINTGTPAGVGLGLKPPRYLHPGDTVSLGGAGLGQQSHVCISASPAP